MAAATWGGRMAPWATLKALHLTRHDLVLSGSFSSVLKLIMQHGHLQVANSASEGGHGVIWIVLNGAVVDDGFGISLRSMFGSALHHLGAESIVFGGVDDPEDEHDFDDMDIIQHAYRHCPPSMGLQHALDAGALGNRARVFLRMVTARMWLHQNCTLTLTAKKPRASPFAPPTLSLQLGDRALPFREIGNIALGLLCNKHTIEGDGFTGPLLGRRMSLDNVLDDDGDVRASGVMDTFQPRDLSSSRRQSREQDAIDISAIGTFSDIGGSRTNEQPTIGLLSHTATDDAAVT